LPGIVLLLLEWKLSPKKQHSILVPTDDHVIPDNQNHDIATGPDEELENDSVLSSKASDEDNQQTGAGQEENDAIVEVVQGSHEGWIQGMFHEPDLVQKVIGSSGSWFLFDVVFYGNTIFQPIVVEAAFGGKGGTDGVDLLRKTATNSLILTSIALPGYAVAGFIMGKRTCCITQTPRYVMLQGFAAMSILYATIGFNWSYLRGYPTTLVLLYGMTFFFANYGPNTTTFILPSLIFEKEHRATWNGIAAAAGKFGALTGATLFVPAADTLGNNAIMIVCAIVAFAAYILTYFTIPKNQPDHDRRQIIETEDTTTLAVHRPNNEVV
jgi:PHS family inorganic phosphate transporter-like MFS transporter